MNINVQRALDRVVGIPLCGFFSLWHRLSGRHGPPGTGSAPRAILVILLSEMGSLVLAAPMFRRLKREYPHARIYVLLFVNNREVLDLLDVVPPSNVFTLNDRSLWRLMADSARVLMRLRSLGIDAVLDCELFSRVSSLFSYLSGGRLRVGFHPHTQEGLYRGSFINRPMLYTPYRHITLQFLSMVSALESTTTPLCKLPPEPMPDGIPQLEFEPGEKEAASARLHKCFPAIAAKPLVLIYPGGGMLPIRAWPVDYYVELARELLADGYAVGVVGLVRDRALAQSLVRQCGSELCVDLTGHTRAVRDLLALFHRASLLITNDGGPGQFAALTPIPAIVLFGPETPLLYRSLSSRAHHFHTPLPCSPCLTAYNHRATPCDGDNQCLKQIRPAEVLCKARELLTASRLPAVANLSLVP
jgi:ADP-heptose:LPS heptosyltransferase